MAVLQRRDDRRLFEWQVDTVLGRDVLVGLLASDGSAGVSTHHAALTWSARHRCWQVRALGGETTLDGIALAPGSARALGAGALLRLGELEWEVVDVSAPPVHARCARDGQVTLGVDGVLALPDEHAPEVLVVRSPQGWVLRRATLGGDEGEVVGVVDGMAPRVGGRRWQIRLPPTCSEASRWLVRVADARLDLVRGDAGIDAVLRTGGRWHALPARSHHGLLWELARARLQDAGLAVGERGWREAATVLDGGAAGAAGAVGAAGAAGAAARVAVMMQRAQRQLGALGVLDAERLFETRGTALRLPPGGIDVRLLGPGEGVEGRAGALALPGRG